MGVAVLRRIKNEFRLAVAALHRPRRGATEPKRAVWTQTTRERPEPLIEAKGMTIGWALALQARKTAPVIQMPVRINAGNGRVRWRAACVIRKVKHLIAEGGWPALRSNLAMLRSVPLLAR